MDTIFMNSENSKNSKLHVLSDCSWTRTHNHLVCKRTQSVHVLSLKLTNKLDLRIGENSIALSNLSIYYTWKNIKTSYNNNKFKISASIWNDKFELPDGSYSLSDTQDYFKHIFKKHGENVDDPSGQIYANEIKNRVTFKIKKGYTLELVTKETNYR